MIYFYKRGIEALACETRLSETGPGYELVVTQDGESRVETYADMGALLAREQELLTHLLADGWRGLNAPRPAPSWARPALGRRSLVRERDE